MPKISSTMELVEKVLAKHKSARNSDKELIFHVMMESHKLCNFTKREKAQILAAFKEMVPFETITRCRRAIQAAGKHEATSEVIKKRRAYARKMKEMMR